MGGLTFTPKAKNVIWLFMIGGTSHLESFDPKPALNRYGGKTIAETPYADCAQEQADRQRAGRRARRRQRPHPPDALSASGWLSQARPVRNRSQRLVAASRRLHRRHRGDPLDVDDRQQPRRPASVPHRPAHARRAVSQRSARGCTTGWARSTTTCRNSSSWARRSPIAAAGWAATARAISAPSTTVFSLSVDPHNPLPFAAPGRDVFREEQADEFELLGRLNRSVGGQVSRRPRSPRADQVVRAGLPHADRGARGGAIRRRAAGEPAAVRARSRRDAPIRPDVPVGPAAGRARSAVRADLSRLQRRRRRLGRPRRLCGKTTPLSVPRSTGRSPGC